MAQENVVALQESGALSIFDEVARCRLQVREMELTISRKEAELQRVKEEQTLLRELRSVNEMVVRKIQRRKEEGETGHLKIAPESLEELTVLNDALKAESKRTQVLQDEANTLTRQYNEVAKALEEKQELLLVINQATGGETEANKVLEASAVKNEYVEKKRAMAKLIEEEKLTKEHSDRLTAEIETLTHAVEEHQTIDEKIAKAEEELKEQRSKHASLLEDVKSFDRLRRKKERLLEQKDDDGYRAVRQMEGDKKVLHNAITTQRETCGRNSKSITALEARLRQLEGQLEAAHSFIRNLFAEVGDDEPMENIASDADSVTLGQFEDLARELDLARETIKRRDEELDAHDAKVEQLEQKLFILQNAISSRAVSSQLQVREKEREFETLMAHVEHMKREFEREYKRLFDENAALRRTLQAA